LTSGNIGLLKHAPNVFGCAKLIEEIFVKLDTQKCFPKPDSTSRSNRANYSSPNCKNYNTDR
jgi:hypothetical protein